MAASKTYKSPPGSRNLSSPTGRTALVPVAEVDSHWITNVTVGGQTVTLCIDTGSSPLWVSAPDIARGQKRGYDLNRSLTAKAEPDSAFNISFPNIRAWGTVIQDDVALSSNDNIHLEDFAFGMVNQMSSTSDEAWDGLLGFGFRNASLNGRNTRIASLNSLRAPSSSRLTAGKETILGLPTFFESLMPTLKSPTFALDFQRRTNDSMLPSIKFGGTDPTRYAGELAYVNIDNSSSRWTANNITFSVGGQLMEESANITFDTGLGASIFVPMSIIDVYYSQVPDLQWGNQMGYNCTVVIPCNSKLLDFEMHIGNGTARIGSGNMMGIPISGLVNSAWNAGMVIRLLRSP
ncbi:MAG: hypothetical protein L6R41_000592 [Letrouitia leprolyta]|nr:MAG: hypothetical protein L6R41_000592 [Letrouitia leprolyta]